MHSSKVLLTLSTLTMGALSRGLEQRAASKYTTTITTTETVLSTITTTSPYTFSTDVESTGALEIIPGVLTMTFDELPAYIYFETQIADTTVSTSYKTKTTKITTTSAKATTTAKTSSTASSAVTPVAAVQADASTSSTSSAAAATPTKSIAGCNVEGKAGTTQAKYVFGQSKQKDIVTCQGSCFYTTACQSYSYNVTSTICIQYNTGASGLDVVAGDTNTFFSKKYPGDGSNFCFGTTGY